MAVGRNVVRAESVDGLLVVELVQFLVVRLGPLGGVEVAPRLMCDDGRWGGSSDGGGSRGGVSGDKRGVECGDGVERGISGAKVRSVVVRSRVGVSY